jgi:hypothetical protein
MKKQLKHIKLKRIIKRIFINMHTTIHVANKWDV